MNAKHHERQSDTTKQCGHNAFPCTVTESAKSQMSNVGIPGCIHFGNVGHTSGRLELCHGHLVFLSRV